MADEERDPNYCFTHQQIEQPTPPPTEEDN